MGPGMGMGMQLQHKQTMQLILAPRMIQSMEILQLPIMALQERIQQELQENPVLEVRETEETAEATEPVAAAEETRDPGDGELVLDGGENGELDFDRLEALSKDWEDHFNEDHRPSRNSMDEEGDKKHDAMQNMASRPQSLQDYLSDQLAFLDIPAEQMKLVRYIIAYVDDNGFLSVPDETDPQRRRRRCPSLDELAQAYEGVVTAAQLEEALLVVQKLDPPGVGARDLRECLLLQVLPE